MQGDLNRPPLRPSPAFDQQSPLGVTQQAFTTVAE